MGYNTHELTQLRAKPYFTSELFPEKPRNLTLQQLTRHHSQEETNKIEGFSTIITKYRTRLETEQYGIGVDLGMGIMRDKCREQFKEYSARRLFFWLSNSKELTNLFMNDEKLWKDQIAKINPNATSTDNSFTQWKIQFLTQEYSYWKCRSLEYETGVTPLKELLDSLDKDPLESLHEEDSGPTMRLATN